MHQRWHRKSRREKLCDINEMKERESKSDIEIMEVIGIKPIDPIYFNEHSRKNTKIAGNISMDYLALLRQKHNVEKMKQTNLGALMEKEIRHTLIGFPKRYSFNSSPQLKLIMEDNKAEYGVDNIKNILQQHTKFDFKRYSPEARKYAALHKYDKPISRNQNLELCSKTETNILKTPDTNNKFLPSIANNSSHIRYSANKTSPKKSTISLKLTYNNIFNLLDKSEANEDSIKIPQKPPRPISEQKLSKLPASEHKQIKTKFDDLEMKNSSFLPRAPRIIINSPSLTQITPTAFLSARYVPANSKSTKFNVYKTPISPMGNPRASLDRKFLQRIEAKKELDKLIESCVEMKRESKIINITLDGKLDENSKI